MSDLTRQQLCAALQISESTVRRLELDGLPYTLVSDAAHLMAQGQPFAACYWDTEEGRVFGLRAADDGVDVSEIAKEYGGGGHAKAAGFKVPRGHSLAMA